MNDKYNDLPPKDIKFGHALLPYFSFQPNYINVNFASYGSPPKYVAQAKKRYNEIIEFNPETYYKHEMEKKVDSVKSNIAKFYNIEDIDDIVMLDSISEGISSILRSYPFEKDDYLLVFDYSYPMLRYVAQFCDDAKIVKMAKLHMTIDMMKTKKAAFQGIKDLIENFPGKIKMALIEHITSMPSVIFPAKELVQLCKEKGIVSVIDGAHTYCVIDVDVADINPDFYLGNLNKWGFLSVGVSFMYARKDMQKLIHPAVITEAYGQGYKQEFLSTIRECRDHSAWFTIVEADRFREALGGLQRIRDYNHKLILEAGKRIVEIWGTEGLTEDESMVGYMTNVLLPIQNPERFVSVPKMVAEIFERYHIIVVILKFDGKYFVRFAAQVINELSDYEYAANAVLEYFEIKINTNEKMPVPKELKQTNANIIPHIF